MRIGKVGMIEQSTKDKRIVYLVLYLWSQGVSPLSCGYAREEGLGCLQDS